MRSAKPGSASIDAKSPRFPACGSTPAASEAAYVPDSEACTQTIMNQAHQTLDFSRVVERAWADGVRVFVEHGPMSACSGWIRDVLGERMRAKRSCGSLDRKGRGIEVDLRGDRCADRRRRSASIPRDC